MTRHCTVFALAAGLLFVVNFQSSFGQAIDNPQSATPPQGSVAGAGVAVIKRQPELMRMRLELTATGKDLKEALANLKARREAALKVCAAENAVADSIVVGSPRIAPDVAQRARMMGYSTSTTIRSGRNKKPEPAPPVNVSASLTAEWPLQGSDAEELLLASQSLQSKLKAELAKSAPKIELSPEQEEMQEEAMQNMGNPNVSKPGDPVFYFVAKISNADYVKAAAKAFAMAKTHAQRLASAAGGSLGELRNVEGNDRQTMMMMNYQRDPFGGMQEVDSSEQENNPDEAVGTNPTEVRLNITIAATFALGK